ncbi:MAG: hypothetical protein V3U27_13200 [Candidatus Tectomicrobia bacterium]
MPLALHQPTPFEPPSPSFKPGRKLSVVALAVLWQRLDEDPLCPSRVLLDHLAQHQRGVQVSVRHLNRLRRQWQRHRPKGRPRRPRPGTVQETPSTALVQVTPHLARVGVHLFARWLEQQGRLTPLVHALQQAIDAYQRDHRGDESQSSDVDFALLHHREATLLRRLQAILLAPLLGIERLSEFDTHETPLETIIGQSYQSSTLTQFLGQLERINAAEALMPLLLPPATAILTYIDGHMIPYWSGLSMHKGKITMLGRIMAGSQALIAHNEAAHALFVAYYAPDLPLSQIIVAYCQQLVMITGSDLFVIDRAVNSWAMAQAFTEQGWGLLCMLDDNEHRGLSSFAARPLGRLDDGAGVFFGAWKEARPDDPRRFVIVESLAGKTLVYWGTPRLLDTLVPLQWPGVYRQRNEIQENSFKRMIDHGALNINYGRKTIVSADRHQQRKRAKLAEDSASTQRRLEAKEAALVVQQAKVSESEHKGHGKRLQQRQRTLDELQDEVQAVQAKQAQLHEQVEALGEPKERRDRDFRKQTIMTFRTLWLENALLAFIASLVGQLSLTISSPCLLTLLFERSGTRVETAWQVIYEVNGAGLSMPYRQLMTEVIAGLNAMDLRERGKPIQVRLKDRPP